MKNIIENVKLVVQMGIIGIILLYIGTTVFMPNLTVKIFKFQPFVVVTESMEPVINVNDMVVVKEFDLDTAAVGDIITFEADIDYNGTMEVVTHYIYSIETTDGETIIRTHRHFDDVTLATPDTWLITSDQVLGTYSFHVQYIGYITGFVKSIYGMAVIGANVLIIGAITFITKRAKRKEEQEQEQLMQNQEQNSQPVLL